MKRTTWREAGRAARGGRGLVVPAEPTVPRLNAQARRLTFVSAGRTLMPPPANMAFIARAVRHARGAAQVPRRRTPVLAERLPYQHEFHAGNFADVMKHTVLLLLLQRMGDKESPFTYVETHAGAGSYDLIAGKAARLNEQADGIELLLNLADRDGLSSLPAPAQTLVEMSRGREYPGSPRIAAEQLRPQDSLLLCELAPEPHAQLCRCSPIDALIADGRARVLCADGYKAVRLRDGEAAAGPHKTPWKTQKTPQKRPRALVLIDPPYQMGGDTERIVQLVGHLARHWRSARVAIWLPIRDDGRRATSVASPVSPHHSTPAPLYPPTHLYRAARMYEQLAALDVPGDILVAELVGG